jgi:predicted enzyme related to lactoylglutathione lyase
MTQPSRFIWYELLTSDLDPALAFYGTVIGWTAQDSGMPGLDYRILSTQSGAVGGAMTAPAALPPCWLGYVGTANVDATVAAFIAAGGQVHRPAMDLPGVGRIALVADAQGAMLYLMQPFSEGVSTAFAASKPGHAGWNELNTTDWEAAFALYAPLFGWEKSRPMDMGPMGTYQLFSAGGEEIGAMFNSPDAPRPHWLFYFNVADIDAAKARLEAAGGRTLMGPHPVPGDLWMIQALDPQGAAFAMVGPRAA